MADIFRKSQLDKLSSPDQMDKMMVITSTSIWIALIGGGVIVLVAFLWSVLGSMPQKVETSGIYMADQNAYTLSSEINGIVDGVNIKIGDEILSGDVMYTLDAKSLEKEKQELIERRDIVESVTLDSTGDVSTSDTQPLLDIKNQIASAGSQVSQNATMLKLRETELEEQKKITDEAYDKVTEARLALENYQNENSDIQNHYNYVNDAWSKVVSYRSAMDASENVMQEAKDNLDYYSYFSSSTDPQEKADYDAAYSTYTTAVQTYYSNKTQYESSLYSYNDLLNTYFPDAQPSVAPDKQTPNLVTYVNAYNGQVSDFQQKQEVAQNDYSNEYSKQASLESEISSLKVQIAAGVNGEGISVEGYEKQFDTTKETTLNSLDLEIKKYDDNISDNEVKSSVSGTVSDIKVSIGGMVSQGSATVVVRKHNDTGDLVICYVDLANAKRIQPGMDVKVYPSTANQQEYGNMVAKVQSVDDYVSSQAQMVSVLGDETLAQTFSANGPVICVRCELEKDPESVSGYKWSSKKGAELTVPQGTLVSADVITEYKKPITMLIPYLKDKFSSNMEQEGSED